MGPKKNILSVLYEAHAPVVGRIVRRRFVAIHRVSVLKWGLQGGELRGASHHENSIRVLYTVRSLWGTVARRPSVGQKGPVYKRGKRYTQSSTLSESRV